MRSAVADPLGAQLQGAPRSKLSPLTSRSPFLEGFLEICCIQLTRPVSSG